MSKADDIPAQLLVDACEALADSTGIHPDSLEPAYVECMAYHMHKAIMAERERCVKIARSQRVAWSSAEYFGGFNDGCNAVAVAIRKGE